MGWRGVTVMDQRVRFIAEYLRGYFSFTELCRHFDISRKTGYKWAERYRTYGARGLSDQSRRPHHSPHQTSEEIVQEILRARKRHPTWGPKKLCAHVSSQYSELDMPAVSTIADILKRNGLIALGKRRVRRRHPGCLKSEPVAPNDIWTADYKGQFKLKNGRYCYPLTVCDLYSRYLIGCEGHDAISFRGAKRHFSRLFAEYGLPQRIRTDNGVPFASNAIARLSSLSAWWIKLGIYPEQIEPGKPQQNGAHERTHLTLKKEAAIPSENTLSAQQERFDRFRAEYNHERPHEALAMKTPSSLYKHSEHRMPQTIRSYDYPLHFEIRRVGTNGGISWKTRWVAVSQTLSAEYIGLEETEYGIYNVYFCNFLFGRFFEEIGMIKDITDTTSL